MWLKNFYRSASRLVIAKIPKGNEKIGLRHVKYKERQNAIEKFRQNETAGSPQLENEKVLFFKVLNDQNVKWYWRCQSVSRKFSSKYNYLVSFRLLIFVMSLFLAIFRFNQTMKNVVSKLLENSTTDSDGTSGSEKVGELKIGTIESLDWIEAKANGVLSMFGKWFLEKLSHQLI